MGTRSKTRELHHDEADSVGGGKRDRTADLLHAMQALSQLSYTPAENRELYKLARLIAKQQFGTMRFIRRIAPENARLVNRAQ
jgi:hypothetical protein